MCLRNLWASIKKLIIFWLGSGLLITCPCMRSVAENRLVQLTFLNSSTMQSITLSCCSAENFSFQIPQMSWTNFVSRYSTSEKMYDLFGCQHNLSRTHIWGLKWKQWNKKKTWKKSPPSSSDFNFSISHTSHELHSSLASLKFAK